MAAFAVTIGVKRTLESLQTVGTVEASWGTSRFLEGFGVGVFAEFLKAADKGEKAKGADNLRKGRALLEKQVKGAKPIELSTTVWMTTM